MEQASEQAGKRRSAPVVNKIWERSEAASYFSHSLAVSLLLPAFYDGNACYPG